MDEAIKELETFRLYYVDFDDENHQHEPDIPADREIGVALGTEQLDSLSSINENTDDEECPDVQTETASVYKNWKRFGFFDPLRVVFELSAFPTLTCIYKILATLPVTSCSAERAMSRLRIIKNRLRSTISDERLDSLMIIASESDILEKISTDQIIDKFAMSSESLKNLLLPTQSSN